MHAVAAARSQWEEQAFAIAWQEGRALTPEQVPAARVAARPEPPTVVPLSLLPGPRPPASEAGLTAREVEVLRLVAQGLTDAQVAERLVMIFPVSSLVTSFGFPPQLPVIDHHNEQ